MKLKQKQGLKRRTFELAGDKLKMTYKTSSEIKEWSVNLDSIGNEILIERKSRKGGLFLGLFFLAFGIFILAAYVLSGDNNLSLWAIIAMGIFYIGLGTLIFLSPLKNELHITGGYSQVIFFLESPSREHVEKFANSLIEKSKTIILSRYSKIDPDIPKETMMNQLNWLRTRGLLSENEYEQKKQEYKLKKIIN